ncbi:MAG: D-2-hydroxyacid dehydrogenase [Oscillospiraceae bacterium]|nr:D-2-hydroxyacid dehydrogenase [Oscillospiraceae bacterium]
MRKIAVLSSYMEEHHIRQIIDTAQRCGFTADFYPDDTIPPEKRGEYEVLYGMPDGPFLKTMTAMKWFCTPSAGVDTYCADELYCDPDNILLTNSSGAYGITIAEHILMVTLMLLRRQMDIQKIVDEGRWVRTLPVRSICGSTITILGTGDIGTTFARRAKALGAKAVYGVRRTKKAADPVFDQVCTHDEMDELLPRTDILVMALPGTADTAGILSRRRIALLPPNAYVVNVGRGSAVDQEALMDALNAEMLAGAALDVMVPEPLPLGHPLRSTKNVLITPHVSGNMSLGITRDLDVDMFCADLENYTSGRPLKQLVNRKLGY